MAKLKLFRKLWPQIKRRLLQVRLGRYPLIPLIVVLMFILTALFSNFLAPYPPNQVNLPDKLLPPFWIEGGSMAHPLGTDELGRDQLSRLIFGSRISLLVAVLAIGVGGVAGTALAIIAGVYGGKVDAVIMRIADATVAFPAILLALFLGVTVGPGLFTVVLALSIALWARFARTLRGEVLSVSQRDFVALARVAGCSRMRTMVQHIFPNVMNTTVVMLTLHVGYAIILEASLSFLGAGIPHPTASWGNMIAHGREYLRSAWWLSISPGLAILIVVLSFNLLGDWLRDVLDPKMRQIHP